MRKNTIHATDIRQTQNRIQDDVLHGKHTFT